MSYSQAVEAVKAHIAASWTATPVVFEGERFERPDPPTPFLLVEVEGGSGRPRSIGGANYRHQGSVTVTAFVPTDAAGLTYDMAERVGQLLAQRSFPEAGARLWAPSFGRLLPAEGDTGWLSLSIEIPMQVDVTYA